jgi:hypothetical protein
MRAAWGWLAAIVLGVLVVSGAAAWVVAIAWLMS